MCSIYFDIGNTVVADNITARARGEVWKMAKGLGLRQTITDGGFYSPEAVFSLKTGGKKPSFAILSDIRKLEKHQYVKKIRLGCVDWEKLFKENPKQLFQEKIDIFSTSHLNEFWGNYDLKMKMDIEHKIENFSLKTGFLNKANYAFKRYTQNSEVWDNMKYAIRSVGKKETQNANPTVDILRQCTVLSKEEVMIPDILKHQETRLLTLNGFRKIQKNKINELNKSLGESCDGENENIKLSSLFFNKNLLPGDKIYVDKQLKFNNLYCYIQNEEEYKPKKRRGSYENGFEKKSKQLHIVVKNMNENNF